MKYTVPATNPGVPVIFAEKVIDCPTAAYNDVPVKVRMDVLVTVVIVINCAANTPLFLHETTRLFASTVYVPASWGSNHMVGDKSYGVNVRLKNCEVGTTGVSDGGGNL